MAKSTQKLANKKLIFALLLLTILSISFSHIQAKKHKHRQARSRCQQDECLLKPAHYAIYANLKQALDSKFDLSGKDLVPFIRSVQVLKLRYQDEPKSNASRVIRALLDDEALQSAMKVFASDDGRALIDIYRSSVNGKRQNLACSEFRIDEIERATAKLEADERLANVFAKVHRNFVKKSAKKCLKHSCNTIDASMSRLDFVLGKRQSSHYYDDYDKLAEINQTDLMASSNEIERREFDRQELELCKFFKKTNETDCILKGSEMKEINLLPAKVIDSNGTDKMNPVDEYIKAYQANHDQENPGLVGEHILSQCHTMHGILDLNLAALKWYHRQNFIEDQKMSVRTFWCPGLSYWLQVDRLCDELSVVLGRSSLGNGSDTFAYEISRASVKPLRLQTIH